MPVLLVVQKQCYFRRIRRYDDMDVSVNPYGTDNRVCTLVLRLIMLEHTHTTDLDDS